MASATVKYGYIDDDLAAGLAFLLQRLQFGKHRRHQLDDDGAEM